MAQRSRRKQLSTESDSLWSRIQSYSSGYVEKTILLNSAVAAQIAQNIAVHTRGDKHTRFLDAEGGTCQIAANLQQMALFEDIRVLEKDMELFELHKYAKDNYLDPQTEIHSLNINKIVPDATQTRMFESPLLAHFPERGNIINHRVNSC